MRFFILLFFASIFYACENYIEIEVPPLEKKPVLNCLFTENKPFKLHLSMSTDIQDTNLVFIKGAKISLFADNILIEQLQELDSGYYISNYKAQKGVLYRVEADISGYPVLIASDSLPQEISPAQIYFQKNAIYDFGSSYAKAYITFYDPAENNYYEVGLSAKYVYYADWDGQYHEVRVDDNIAYWLIDDDALNNEEITGWIGAVSFTDELFNGNKYQLKLPVKEMYDNAHYYVRFNSVSHHYYKHKSTMDKHLFNQGGWSYDGLLLIDGGNPVSMYGNVENGYGIFAGYISEFIEVTDIRE